MSGPWEKFQPQAAPAGPWQKFQAAAPPPAPAPGVGTQPEYDAAGNVTGQQELPGSTNNPVQPPGPPQQTLPNVDNGHNWLTNLMLGAGGQFNKNVLGALTFLPRLANKGLAAAGVVDDPNTMDRLDQRMKSAVAPIDVSNTRMGRMGAAGGDAATAGLAMSAMPALGPAETLTTAVPRLTGQILRKTGQDAAGDAITALAPTGESAVSQVGNAFQRGLGEIMSKPLTTGGLVSNAEANMASGATGQGVAEKFGEKYRPLGETGGAALPGLMPMVLGSKAASALGLMSEGPARTAAGLVIPDSATGATRAAERKAFVGRGVDDEGNVLKAPSGADYSNPATPAPAGPSAKERVQDYAEGVRNDNAMAHLQRQFSSVFKDPEIQKNLGRADDLKKEVPGFNPTLGEATGNQPLLLKQKQIEENMTGDELVGRQKQKDDSNAAIERYGDSRVARVGPDSDAAVGNAARDIVGERGTRAAADAENATRGIKAVSDTLPNIPQQDTGKVIRQGYQQGQQAEDAVVKGNRKAVIDAGADTRMPTGPLHEGIQSDLAELRTSLTDPAVPPSVRKLLGRTESSGPAPGEPRPGLDTALAGADRAQGIGVDKGSPEYDIEGLLSAREDTNKAMRQAKANQDNGSLRVLGKVKDRLDAEAARLETENPNSDLSAKLKAYNDHYREVYAPNYSQGLGNEALHTDATSRPVVEDQDITKRLVSPNASIEDTKQNLRVNATGQGRQATRNANLDDMRSKVVDPTTGMIKQGEIDKYLATNRNRLAEDPKMAKLLKSKDPQELYDALNAAHADAAANADSTLAKTFGDTRSDGRKLNEAFDDPKQMRAIKDEAAKDPELDAALKRAVWERVMKDPQSVRADPQKLFNIVFGDNPAHLKDLHTISDAVAMSERSGRAKGSAEDFKPPIAGGLQDITGSSASSTLNKIWGVRTGRTSPSWLAIDQGLRVLNNFGEKHYEAALKNAIYNPDTARLIATSIRNKSATPMMRSKIGQILLGDPTETRAPNQGLTTTVVDTAKRDADQGQNEITVHPRKNR